MTLRQTIQAASGKTAELITKLSGTTNEAIKTREGLFAQLNDELTRYVEVEEQHFLPLLRKHEDTRGLAADALKGNKDLRHSLGKLAQMPIGTDEFLAELGALEKSFQQHVRNERKELLPAVLKALSDDEAGALAETIEGAVADAERAARDEKRTVNAEAKRQAEQAEQAKADARAASRTQKAAEKAARDASEKAAETFARGTASVQDGARRVAETVKDEGRKVASDTRAALSVVSKTTQTVRDDVQAIAASSTVSTAAASEVYSVWREWLGNVLRINADAAQKMMQARTMHQVVECQNQLAISALRNWMEGNAKVLEISRRSSTQALGPLNDRLSDAA